MSCPAVFFEPKLPKYLIFGRSFSLWGFAFIAIWFGWFRRFRAFALGGIDIVTFAAFFVGLPLVVAVFVTFVLAFFVAFVLAVIAFFGFLAGFVFSF